MASPDEKREIEDLHDLFGHSEVPRGTFLKFSVAKHNREIADRGRQEREERQRLLEERAEEQHRRIQRLRAKRGERDREAVDRLHQQNRENAQRIKMEEQQWEAQVMQERMELKRQVHERGSADFHNARLAEKEAREDQERRDKATADHQAYLKRMREANDAKKRAREANAGRMLQEVEQAHSNSKAKLSQMKNSLADKAKEDKRAWREQLERNRQEALERARANRRHAEEVRERARAKREEQTKNRQNEGNRMQRAMDEEANRAKTEMTNYKKQLRAERYKSRYINADEEQEMLNEQSTQGFLKLYGHGMPKGHTSSQIQ